MELNDSLNSFSKTQKVTLILGALVILVLLFASFFLFFSPKEQGVLFSDLHEQDAAVVMEALEKEKIDYSISGNGTEILVPNEDVHRTRLKLMSSDMPIHGGVGFEIFNDSSFGTTEFAQRVNYQRALQGELTRTIMALEEVKYARIHLVLPENSLFNRKGQVASASVALLLQPGVLPNQSQILGIQKLVAASVPQLDSDNVTIVDQNGIVLSKLKESEEIQIVSGELKQKRSYEAYLKGKAEQVLENTFGIGNFSVSIDVTIDYSQSSITTEDILPSNKGNKQGLLKLKEYSSPVQSEKADKPNKTREEEYVVGRSVSKTMKRPGDILKISVGVLVPQITNDSEMAKSEQLVAMAVGLNRDRGDEIAVYPIFKQESVDVVTMVTNEANLDSAERPASVINNQDSNDTLRPSWPQVYDNKITIYLFLAILFAVVVGVIIGRIFKREKSLSKSEREQLLLTLQTWVNNDGKSDNVVEIQ